MIVFSIRPAFPQDALVAARLIALSMGPMADFLFASRVGPGGAEAVLADLFARPGNRFSHQFAEVAEVGGRAVGLLIAYSSHLMGRLAVAMGRQLAETRGVRGILRLMPRVLPLAPFREAEAGEYFINTLAVLPEFQGQGIGSRLLLRAEERAAGEGLSRCALSVEVENLRAKRLYERAGFRIVRTFEHPWLERFCGCRGFHRMVKMTM